MSTWMMYLLVMMDNVKCLLLIFAIVSGSIWIASLIIGALRLSECDSDEEAKITKQHIDFVKRITPITLIFILLSLGTPNSKQLVAIWLVPKMANAVQANEQMQELPDNILNLANEWIEAMRPEKQDKEQK